MPLLGEGQGVVLVGEEGLFLPALGAEDEEGVGDGRGAQVRSASWRRRRIRASFSPATTRPISKAGTPAWNRPATSRATSSP